MHTALIKNTKCTLATTYNTIATTQNTVGSHSNCTATLWQPSTTPVFLKSCKTILSEIRHAEFHGDSRSARLEAGAKHGSPQRWHGHYAVISAGGAPSPLSFSISMRARMITLLFLLCPVITWLTEPNTCNAKEKERAHTQRDTGTIIYATK